MGYKNKIYDLKTQAKIILKQKCKFGKSRREDKALGIDGAYIYSYSTLETYIKSLNHLIDYATKIGFKTKKVQDLVAIVPQFLDDCRARKLSAWTIATYASAFSKFFKESFEYDRPKRHRKDIKRGRDLSRLEFDWEGNKLLVDLCRCSGLRRHEIKQVNCDHLEFRNGKYYLVNIKGKGGKIRIIELLNPTPEVIYLISNSKKTVTEYINIPKRAPIHALRREYATNFYLSYVSQDEQVPYFCKKDMKGVAFDRKKMLASSIQLGHNRIDVIAENYLDSIECNQYDYFSKHQEYKLYKK